jgi:hypothetical protein
MGGVLRVEIVVLATPTPILLVRSRDLEDRDLCLLHKAQEPCAVAAGRLDSDALKLTEGEHPGEHLAIALPGRGEGSCSEDPILLIDNRCDVKILMSIDAADNVSLSPFDDRHSQPPDCHALTGFTGTECADRTVTRPWRSGPSRVTGIGEAKPHRKAFPGGRQVRGKTRPGRSECGSDRTGRLTAPA